MRLFQGLRRPLGGFMIDPAMPEIRRQQERDARQAEAERLRYIRLVQQTNRRLENLMKTMDDVLQEVYAQRGQIESLSALTGSIKQKLTEALAAAGPLTQAQQDQIDKVFNELEANKSALTKAINANDDDPSNDPAPEQPKRAATSVAVSSSANPSVAGQPVTFTAAVSAAPGFDKPITGGVAFYADDNQIGSAALDSTGVAAFSVTPPVGEHDITASYSGDAAYAPSDSAEITQVVKDAEAPPPPVDESASTAQG